MPRSIAIVGGGIAGLAAAYELAKLQREGADLTFTLIEASNRLGGIVETVREQGFIIETGPDAWVTEKPWARQLAEELGLADQIIASNDADRVTYILRNGQLLPMPDNMRMMVPADLSALDGNELFSSKARAAYQAEPARAEELKRRAPQSDESVASFVDRHFGAEILRVIGAPLLNGVFGGDVRKLSVQAVMQPFVKMEREVGSLILAVQARNAQHHQDSGGKPRPATFTTLRNGVGTLAEAMAQTLPPGSVGLSQRALHLRRDGTRWALRRVPNLDGRAHLRRRVLAREESFDAVLLATPVATTAALLHPLDRHAAQLVNIPASSALTVAFGFGAGNSITWPRGFGFLAPEGEKSRLLAATFVDQKFSDRVPPGGRLVRTYFGGTTADKLSRQPDDTIAQLARTELEKIVGPLPGPAVTVVRRWPQALPQYETGHLTRMAELDQRITRLGNLHLLGNGYRGVGLPDLIRDARSAACQAATTAI